MARSVKLSDDIMEEVRLESEIQSRSLASQITHWIRIGKAIERSGNFSHTRINAVLKGKAPTATLTDEEYPVWSQRFEELMTQPTPEAEAFFAERRRLGLGVGLNENGNLVQAADLLNKPNS